MDTIIAVAIRSAYLNAQKASLLSALAVMAVPKDKLTDGTDKALWIRASRAVWTACEAIDGKSYHTLAEYQRGDAYKAASATLRGKPAAS